MVLFPNCKINLGLNIVRKREDGYHDIETIFIPLPWSDILEITPLPEKEKSVEFKSTGLRIYGTKETNLCVKAYHLLAQDFTLGAVRMHLHKLIPIGAGLGGGSSDAAFALKGLNQLFQLKLDDQQLESYAAQLGSDCPFFIRNKPVFASGRGEIFEDIRLKTDNLFVVAVKPRIHVSTAEAYAGVQPATPTHSLKERIRKPLESWKDHIRNDFENTVLEKYPSLKRIKKKLYDEGAIYAAMSGSGSTIYGIFEKPIDLHLHFRSYHVWQGYAGSGN